MESLIFLEMKYFTVITVVVVACLAPAYGAPINTPDAEDVKNYLARLLQTCQGINDINMSVSKDAKMGSSVIALNTLYIMKGMPGNYDEHIKNLMTANEQFHDQD